MGEVQDGRELWSAADIARHFGWRGGASYARVWVARNGISWVALSARNKTTRLYDPAAVTGRRERLLAERDERIAARKAQHR